MNFDLHGLIALALANPIITLAVIASTVVGAALPWLVEANASTDEWGGLKFRMITYGAAILGGLLAGVTIWHSVTALCLWVPPLGINCARDIASHFLPWLSPRQQQVTIRRDAQGQPVGVKVGDDPTIMITRRKDAP